MLIAFILLFWLYFLYIEVKQMVAHRMKYFKSFWNWIDMISLSLNIIYLISDLLLYEPGNMRNLSSIAILLMWLKMLYFLRLFAPTAALIRMVV